MSIEIGERTPLASWIARLVRALDTDPGGAGQRLRRLVEGRAAHITLDGEAVRVAMREGQLLVGPARPSDPVDGSGATTAATVRAILAGELEAAAAVEDGHIEVAGEVEAVCRMFAAVELLLDGAARVPELRRLAAEFIGEHGGEPAAPRPREGDTAELAMLGRLGLLRSGEGAS